MWVWVVGGVRRSRLVSTKSRTCDEALADGWFGVCGCGCDDDQACPISCWRRTSTWGTGCPAARRASLTYGTHPRLSPTPEL